MLTFCLLAIPKAHADILLFFIRNEIFSIYHVFCETRKDKIPTRWDNSIYSLCSCSFFSNFLEISVLEQDRIRLIAALEVVDNEA